jgi:hypothetical protein
MHRWAAVGWVCIGAIGCVPGSSETLLVPHSILGPTAPPLQTLKMPENPAAAETAVRVAHIGQKLLAANPKAGLQPLFTTVGVDWEEIFHRGEREVVITEGLVKRCKNDGQIAALLAQELARMAAEREALHGTSAAGTTKGPPPAVLVGGDAAGTFGSPDGTRLAELGKYARDRKPTRLSLAPETDPLARQYLSNAEFPSAALDDVQPLLRAARKNARMERQMGPAAEGTVNVPLIRP